MFQLLKTEVKDITILVYDKTLFTIIGPGSCSEVIFICN
jgi:hypothetical protein